MSKVTKCKREVLRGKECRKGIVYCCMLPYNEDGLNSRSKEIQFDGFVENECLRGTNQSGWKSTRMGTDNRHKATEGEEKAAALASSWATLAPAMALTS